MIKAERKLWNGGFKAFHKCDENNDMVYYLPFEIELGCSSYKEVSQILKLIVFKKVFIARS